jgi:hypothetical protein
MHGASGGDMGEDPFTKRMMKWTYTYGCFLSALKDFSNTSSNSAPEIDKKK